MKKNGAQYQYGYSNIHFDSMYDHKGRSRKAKTMVSVLQEFIGTDLNRLTLLDVGSSTGFISNYLSKYFGHVTGIDIDRPAVDFASETFQKKNLSFIQSDSLNILQPENQFDVVICAQVYEHVPDAVQMMNEIFRVLKPGGICYFAAGNRLRLIEPHYNLPFLSIIPRTLAHKYMRLTGKGDMYYEKHFSYWGLKRLIKKFECIDYTQKIIENPSLYHAEYMLPVGSTKQRFAEFIVKNLPWISPGYVWLLKKIVSKNTP